MGENNLDREYPVVQKALSVLALLLVFGSINYVDLMYWSALIMLLGSLVALFIIRPRQSFIAEEKLLIGVLLLYPLVSAINILVRGEWDWSAFQESSRFLLIVPVFLLIRAVGISSNIWRWGALFGAIGAGLWAIYQRDLLDITRAFGGTHNLIAAFGNIALVMVFFTIILFYKNMRLNVLWSALVVFACCLAAYASIASGNKGGWISLPFMFALLLTLDETWSTKVKLSATLVFCLSIAAVYLLSPYVQSRVDVILPAIYHYFVNGTEYDGSAGARLSLWHVSLLIFLDNPLIGIGLDNFNEVAKQYVDLRTNFSRSLHQGPHNQFMLSLVRFGVAGPVLVFGIYAAFAYFCRQHMHIHRPLALCGLVLVVGFIDFGMVDFVWERNNFGVFFTFVMAIIGGQLAYLRRTGQNSLC